MTKIYIFKNASVRQETIRRVGIRQKTIRSMSVTAPKISLQKESNFDGTEENKKVESSSFVGKQTK